MLRVVVLLLLVAIVGSLLSGLFYLWRDRGGGERLARALSWRIGLSLALFAVLLIGFRCGFIPGYSQ